MRIYSLEHSPPKNRPDEPSSSMEPAQAALPISTGALFVPQNTWSLLKEKLLEPLANRKDADSPIRVWAIGSAGGEDTYTLAILLHEVCEQLDKTSPIQIFSTSNPQDTLVRARAGVLPAAAITQIPKTLRHKYFTATNNGQDYRVKRKLRASVIFGTHDALIDPPLSGVDLILLHHSPTNLERAKQQELLKNLYASLRPGGYLLLGETEIAEPLDSWFMTISRAHGIYRKLDEIQHIPEIVPGRNAQDESAVLQNELQTATQELEKVTEKLHMQDEESNAASPQLQSRIMELESANSHLMNLLENSGIAILCLDLDSRIKWFSPGTQNIFMLKQADIGRPVSHFSQNLLGSGLLQDAELVLKGMAPAQTEFETGRGQWLLRHTLPCRGEQGQIDGVIITFTDITDSKLVSEKTAETHKLFTEMLEQRVAERTSQMQALSFELAMAEERERRALAQDLHDNLGQLLAVAKIKLTSQLKKCGPCDNSPLLDDIQEIVTKANKAIHMLAFQLSPPLQGDAGLLPVFQWVAEELRTVYGLNVKIQDDGHPKNFDQRAKVVIFRAVRELLINVAKHANVSEAMLIVQRKGEHVVITVHDDGKGIDFNAMVTRSHDGGFGLLSMRERISFINGNVEVESYPGEGTTVNIRVPLRMSAPQEAAE